jgi:hypothetical protein
MPQPCSSEQPENCRVRFGPQFAQTVAFLKRKSRASDHNYLTQCELAVKLKCT